MVASASKAADKWQQQLLQAAVPSYKLTCYMLTLHATSHTLLTSYACRYSRTKALKADTRAEALRIARHCRIDVSEAEVRCGRPCAREPTHAHALAPAPRVRPGGAGRGLGLAHSG